MFFFCILNSSHSLTVLTPPMAQPPGGAMTLSLRLDRAAAAPPPMMLREAAVVSSFHLIEDIREFNF